MKAALIVLVVAVLGVIIIAAVIPEKDCNGNNTWQTSEVCSK